MTIRLDHTIVPVRDPQAAAELLAGILGLEVGRDHHGFFVPVELGNGITLDFMASEDFRWHHYAFLVSDEEFDAAFRRVVEAGLPYYATHVRDEAPNEISFTSTGQRGMYFDDPDGHVIELMTGPDAASLDVERWTGPFQPAPAG